MTETSERSAAGAAAHEVRGSAPAAGSIAEALALLEAGLSFLAGADAPALTMAEQAAALRALARAESMQLAAASRVLRAFDVGGGYELDGQRTARSWLRWQTQITSAAAGWATGWVQRLAAHPEVWGALAAGQVSPSWAREICGWTDRLPADRRDSGDAILLDAAVAGAELADLAALAEEMLKRAAPPDEDGDNGFGRRRLRLTQHFRGWGRLEGDLTPAAAAALRAVLDAEGKRTGPEDERTAEQRDHDALEELCRQFVAAGLPDRAGQPTRIELHMTLSQLLAQPEAAAALAAWLAANGATAPPGADCDASIVPVVTGTIEPDVLEQLAAALVGQAAGEAGAGDGQDSESPSGSSARAKRLRPTRRRARFDTGPMAERAARYAVISQAVRLLSGPEGLAAWLRTSQLPDLANSVSLPLDIGRPTETIPPHLRRAIARRDPHCRFPGCDRRVGRCQVHHLVPRSKGGPTSLANCCNLCAFHHLIAIHRWGWKLALHPDGTTTATSPDGTRTLHSHAPPNAA